MIGHGARVTENISVYEGAVMCWRGEKMNEWKNWFMNFNALRGFPIHKPYFQLSREEKDWLWHGTFPSSLTEEQRRAKALAYLDRKAAHGNA